MLHQLVIRRGQSRVLHAVLRPVDDGLLLLNPGSHGKGLWLHGNSRLFQHLEGIPGTVADGQHRRPAGDDFPRIGLYAGELAVFGFQACNLGRKTHLAPQLHNPLSQILHHGQQHVRAHMGLGIIEDVLPGSGLHHLLQHPADSGVVDAGVQLAVGEGARAPLAELDIAARIQAPSRKEGLHLGMTALGILSPLQNQGLPARLSQNQGGKHPRRAEADDHRPEFRGAHRLRRPIMRSGGNGRLLAAAHPKDFILVSLHRHIHGVDDFHIRFLPGIHTPADDGELPDFGIGHPEQPSRLKLELMGIVLRGHGNVPQSNHKLPPAQSPASRPELHAHCKL